MTYPPAKRCSSVSFCAIFVFLFSNSHHTLVMLLLKSPPSERKERLCYDPAALPLIRVPVPARWMELSGLGGATLSPHERLAVTSVGWAWVLSVT